MTRADGAPWARHDEMLGAECTGMLCVHGEDDGQRPFMVRCDQCGQELGVPQRLAARRRWREPDGATA